MPNAATRPVQRLFVQRLLALPLCASLLAGCVTHTVRTVDMTPPDQLAEAQPEELLLDIGVRVFDPNVPEDYDEQVERIITPEIRRSEANFMAYVQKNLLQSTR